MNMTGANVGQVQALAEKFTQTGTDFAGRTADLAREVTSSIQSFEDRIGDLVTKADRLGDDTTREMADVQRQADGVAWTGNNRDLFNNDKATFQTNVANALAQITDDLKAIRTKVLTEFNESLEAFGVDVGKLGENINSNAVETSGNVDAYQDNVSVASNMNWGSPL